MTPEQRTLINGLQGGFPICERPFLAVAERLGLTEEQVIDGIRDLLDTGMLSRFGPMYQAERLGGSLSLVAMKVPEADFERVVELVNAFPEVAHNYAREHELNLWFVLATDRPERKSAVLAAIEAATGLVTLDLPKLAEYYVGLRLVV